VSPHVAEKMAQGVRKSFWYNIWVIDHRCGGAHRRNEKSPLEEFSSELANGRRTWLKKLDLKGAADNQKRSCPKSLKYFYESTGWHGTCWGGRLTLRDKMKRETLKKDLFERRAGTDLEQWAGSRVLSRGQGYHRDHRVRELAQTQSGGIRRLGPRGQRYARSWFWKRELISICTCPYGNNCKHAVAVVLEYLDHVKKKIEIPKTTEKDQRLVLLKEWMRRLGAWVWRGRRWRIDSDRLVSRKSGKLVPVNREVFWRGKRKKQLITLVKDLSGKNIPSV